MAIKGTEFIKKAVKTSTIKAGLPPGTVVYTGEKKTENIRITVFDYSEQFFTERHFESIEDAFQAEFKGEVRWINIDGLHDTAIIEKIGKRYNIHSIVLEDIVHPAQRPKTEEFEENIFTVLKMLTLKNDRIHSEQVSIVFGKKYVLSFQESVGDVFDNIRERIRSAKGRVRKLSSDYLAYCILDSIVDNYFFIIENIGDRIDILQTEVAENPSNELLQRIYELKREMLFIRRAIWPLREVVSNLQKSDCGIINKGTQVFIRDLYDHIVQIIDTAEMLREMNSGILEVYLSSLSNRMNAVMKVLTIIATIFIPLTFIAGVYGMNFENMPELYLEWAYPWAFWVITISIFVGMLAVFKKKKWI